jgi:ATP-dependent Clp protease adaptor protein ClpS
MRKADRQGEGRAGTFICVVRGQYAACGTKGQILAAPLVPRARAHDLRPATSRFMRNGAPMTDIITKPNIKDEIKVERPRLHKVILVNDDFTPREFVVIVLKAEFRMSEDQALRVMMTAHRRGACVVAVYTQDVAEAKATNATDAGQRNGYPLLFTTEPEE